MHKPHFLALIFILITLTNISSSYAAAEINYYNLTEEKRKLRNERRAIEKKPLEFYLKDIDMNNPPNCSRPGAYFFEPDDPFKRIDECGAIFIKKLQDALKKDDKKAVYQMFQKPFKFFVCEKKWRNQCSDYSDHLYHIKITNWQEFIRNYHLMFNDKMIEYIMAASEVAYVGSFHFIHQGLDILIEGESYIVLSTNFLIKEILNAWIK